MYTIKKNILEFNVTHPLDCMGMSHFSSSALPPACLPWLNFAISALEWAVNKLELPTNLDWTRQRERERGNAGFSSVALAEAAIILTLAACAPTLMWKMPFEMCGWVRPRKLSTTKTMLAQHHIRRIYLGKVLNLRWWWNHTILSLTSVFTAPFLPNPTLRKLSTTKQFLHSIAYI